MKRTIIFLIFLMAGLIMGSVLTRIAADVSWLSWLCWGDSIGFGYPEAINLDLSIIQLKLGLYIELNVARLLCLAASMISYLHWGRKL